MDEPGLWYVKPCPSGKFCPASGTAAPSTVSTGYWTEQGAVADMLNKCEPGYTCNAADGSIGPWEEGCPRGEYTGADTATGCDVTNCAAGTYCGQGRNYDCPAGFYCEQGVVEAIECPVGYY